MENRRADSKTVTAVANGVDGPRSRCQFANVKPNNGKTLPASTAEEKTIGMKMVEKCRSRMSRLAAVGRQQLMRRGRQILFPDVGDTEANQAGRT